MNSFKTDDEPADRRVAPEGDAKPDDGAEWGMLMSVCSSRIDLASDMLPAGLMDGPSRKAFGG